MTDTAALRKARGAFFTPPEIARYIAQWAVRDGGETVLEPACGEAAFLLAAGHRLRDLGARSSLNAQLRGVEIHDRSAQIARATLAGEGFSGDICTGDFFRLRAPPSYDAVIGNPPYVRYQDFAGSIRAKALEAALAQGVRLTQLASSWAAFTIHAAHFVRPNGRLGLVLPAELLTVNYAAQVRRFLLRRFGTVHLVVFEKLVFPGVLEEVVLLLAEGCGPTDRLEICQAKNLGDLERIQSLIWSLYAPSDGGKWTPALLPSLALETYQALTQGGAFESLLDWGETSLGSVTGNNDYFTLKTTEVRELGLADDEVVRISPPGSRHIRGLEFSNAAWQQLADNGGQCYLFAPRGRLLSRAARSYIEKGERDNAHTAYKCRTRRPWWGVPTLAKPDLLFTYMNHERPRLATNTAWVHHLNSLYGVSLKRDRRAVGRELLATACLNSVTLLGAEVVGRAYGGGLLKHEPREADILPVPSLETLQVLTEELRMLQPQIAQLLHQNNPSAAIGLVDHVLLENGTGLSGGEVAALREARNLLFRRRLMRSRGERVANR